MSPNLKTSQGGRIGADSDEQQGTETAWSSTERPGREVLASSNSAVCPSRSAGRDPTHDLGLGAQLPFDRIKPHAPAPGDGPDLSSIPKLQDLQRLLDVHGPCFDGNLGQSQLEQGDPSQIEREHDRNPLTHGRTVS